MARPKLDLAKVETTTEEDIARHAAEDGEQLRLNSPFVVRGPGRRGRGKKPAKEQITLRVDPDALAAWRASGDGWMSRAAEVLAREAPKTKRRA